MCLVCKKCGYKQYDSTTIEKFKEKFPEIEEHDIPYYCGACLDDSVEEEYNEMICQMYKIECPLGGDETNDCEGCDYSIDYHFVNGECVKR